MEGMMEGMIAAMMKGMMEETEVMREKIMEEMKKKMMEGMKKEIMEEMKKKMSSKGIMEEMKEKMMQKIMEEQPVIMTERPKGDHPIDEQTKDEQMEIICVKSNDRGANFGELSCVNQNLETIMQKMTLQMAVLTAAFISLGIIFFHSIVQPTIMLSRKWWISFCIFLSVSIIYWYTMQTIIRDYIWVRQEYRLTLDHMQNWSSSAGNGNHWMEKGWFDSFIILYRQIIILYRHSRYLFVVLVAMSAFTSLILYACYSFLHG